jgi:DNA helicase-2/ATP-dependent DNA helicase PcrA
LLTFTRRSAAEMLRRVEELIAITETTKASSSCETVSSNREVAATSQAAADAPNPPDLADRMAAARKRQQGGLSKKVWGGTFHAVAARLLRMYARSLGLAPDFVIHDRPDSEDLLDVVRTGLGLSKKNKRFPKKRTCLAIYSHCVNAQRQLSEVLKQHYPWCEDFAEDLKQLFQKYVDVKDKTAVLDYDDLLLFFASLVEHPEAGPKVAERFGHVLVDEYQDTNVLQARILKGLKPDGRGLTVVGDDAQSIYSFRAATVENIFALSAAV